jgi:hypothetical protein
VVSNILKVIWNRFFLWFVSEEPTKRQPTSLSRVNIPKLDVLKDKAGPNERARIHLVRRRAWLRLVGVFVLWACVVYAYFFQQIFEYNVGRSIIITITAFAIPFLWLFPRRRFFTTTFIKTDFGHVAWSKYYAITQLDTFKRVLGLIVVASFIVTVARTAWEWNSYDAFQRLFLLPFGVVLGVYLLFYCVVLWRTELLHASLDENHEELINEIREGKKDENKITIPTRCYKEDSHNVCVNLIPASTDPADYVEAELQAAGVRVIGDLKQRFPVSSSRLLFFWNCNFATSGSHMVNVLLRVTNAQGEVKRELLRKTYEVHVIALYRQYGPGLISLVTVVIGLLTFLFGQGVLNSMQ